MFGAARCDVGSFRAQNHAVSRASPATREGQLWRAGKLLEKILNLPDGWYVLNQDSDEVTAPMLGGGPRDQGRGWGLVLHYGNLEVRTFTDQGDVDTDSACCQFVKTPCPTPLPTWG